MREVRLLILDDDPQVGKMLQRIAESVGIEARCTTRTDAFFQAVDAWDPTHIAIDLVMPEMDGVEVLIELANRACGARIIITSGLGPRVLDAAGRSANEHGLNIAGVLSKPFSPRMLRTLLVDVPGEKEGPENSQSDAQTRIKSDASLDSTAHELRRALLEDELTLAYQPQVYCKDGEIAGFEALVRWSHPTRGLIMPDQFIGCAEAHGLINELTDQVLDKALRWYAQRFAGTEFTIAVNISSRNPSISPSSRDSGLTHAPDFDFVDEITARMNNGGIKPECLILELTESSAMDDPVKTLAMLTRLRMKGFQLSIDDFGTGYSSMLQLVRLPFSEIKIDKSFVKTATHAAESRVVVESIIGLGRSLGLRVVAEGVEDSETMQYLCEAGCDVAQGYFIGRPMSGDAVSKWIIDDATKFANGSAQQSLRWGP